MSYGRSLSALFALMALGSTGCAEEPADPKYLLDASAATSTDGGATKADAGTKTDSSPATATRDFAAFDDAVQAAIDDYNAGADDAKQIRGASTVVVSRADGVVHTQGYGDFDADRLYLIASSSKILSVGVLMRLADEGKLDIDAPIADYLENWGAHKRGLTVAQLVSNSSGLPSLEEIAGNIGAYAADHLCQYNPAGTLAQCGRTIYADDKAANNRAPDQQFRYGGSQWQLAGAVAEQASGKSWAELIDETYRQPCGVESLGYTNQFSSGGTTYPANFDGDSSEQPDTKNPSIEGGAYITGPDYGKLLWMHLRGGTCGNERVLSEDAVKRMQENRVGDVYGGNTRQPLLPGYGLGWWVAADGVVADPGAYGAYPFIDNERGYAAMLLIEVDTAAGAEISLKTKPELDKLFK